MSADFSEFEDGDIIRVTLEGKWRDNDSYLELADRGRLYLKGSLVNAKRAELVEREIKPFHEGDVVLCGQEPRRRDERGKWLTPEGSTGAFSDEAARTRIKSGMYVPVVLHGKPVDKVEVRRG